MMGMTPSSVIRGAGLGLRRAFMGELREQPHPVADFIELAPENWIGVGGRFGRWLDELSEQYPVTCHGLSLDVGGMRSLDREFLGRLKLFLERFHVPLYSEHLSFSGDDGHLYDLLPLPFTGEAVDYVASRILQVQEVLGQRIAMENISYYATLAGEMSEADFINAVVRKADCLLLLDVNNIVVNACNHGYDAASFLASMPLERVACVHVAGHLTEADDLRIDTHGESVSDPVWDLLRQLYVKAGPLPTVLERDFNLPPLVDLLCEVEQIRSLQGETTLREVV